MVLRGPAQKWSCFTIFEMCLIPEPFYFVSCPIFEEVLNTLLKESKNESCSVVSDSLWPPWTIHTVHGILQARILGWIAFPFSRGSSQPRDWIHISRIAGGFCASWATREAQEYWSGQPIPSPADLPDPGIELGSPALQVDSLLSEPPGKSISIWWFRCIHSLVQ